MADFTNTANTGNNPDEWFSGYTYNNTTDVVGIDLTDALSATGVTDADLKADEGDVRSVYLAIAEALYKAYDAKAGASATTSNRLVMTKSQAVQDNSPIGSADGTSEDIRYTTYTIHIQEKGENIAGFSVGGVADE